MIIVFIGSHCGSAGGIPMGFRFRKSIHLGRGFKVNFSKSGIGYSWGTKDIRFTKTAKGKNRTTFSIPGTGISYATESGGKGTSKSRNIAKTKQSPAGNPGNGGKNMLWLKFILCVFFGFLGVHKFMEKKIGMGILYLFTIGLFGLGWLYDCVRYLIIAVRGTGIPTVESTEEYGSRAEAIPECPSAEIPNHQGVSAKGAGLWVLTVFLLLVALVNLPHISGIFALSAAVLAAPIEKWQTAVARFVKGKAKGIIVAGMTALALFSTPAGNSQEAQPVTPVMANVESTEAAEQSMVPTTEAMTEPETMPPAEVVGISFDGETDAVGVGRTEDVTFALSPAHATTDMLEASIDPSEIATVSLEKKEAHILQVTGIAPGEALLTLKSGEAIAATKTLTIAEVMPKGITIIPEPQTPRIGSNGVFRVEFNPADVTNQKVSWESGTPNVLRVSEDGSYEARSVGMAAITATHENGVSGTVLVEVFPVEVEAVTLSTGWEEGKSFCKNDSMTLTPAIRPENATEKTLTWYSSDETVATVSGKGVVTAVSPGTAQITAEAVNGIAGTYDVVVDVSPQKFRVSASISMKSNDHVGNRWTSGFECNDEALRSGSRVSIKPGETVTICGWAQDNDSRPDYGSYREQFTLTDEMCQSGFTVEGEANVFENSGRYSGNCAVWYVKITFTPIH